MGGQVDPASQARSANLDETSRSPRVAVLEHHARGVWLLHFCSRSLLGLTLPLGVGHSKLPFRLFLRHR